MMASAARKAGMDRGDPPLQDKPSVPSLAGLDDVDRFA
jgi:hypothetical protein